MNNICKNCGKEFRTSRKKSKACTPKCRQKLHNDQTGYYTKYRRRNTRDWDKDCVICNTSFITRNPNQVICSKLECSRKKGMYYKNRNKPKKHCKRCKSEIGAGRWVYCSDECQQPKKVFKCKVCDVQIVKGSVCNDHRKVYKKKEILPRDCETCGKNFTPKSNSARFCKRNCRPSRKAAKKLRRRAKRCVKPKWVSWSDIVEFEKGRPSPNHELDHIIPLNHPKVCGLHCPDNFQWLTNEDNQRKSNKFDGTVENETWKIIS